MGIHTSNKSRRTKSILGAALSTVLAFSGLVIGGSSVFAAPSAAATISAVKFGAPVHSTYDHKTGGGAYNNGATTYVKGELQGTDFACGDITSYIVVLNTDATAAADVTAELVFDFTGDTTGQSGVALQPLLTPDHLKVNSGLIGMNAGTGIGGSDAAFAGGVTGLNTTARIAALPAPTENYVSVAKPNFVSGSTHRLTYSVENLIPGSSNAFRMDARILCKAGSTPTGNEQIALKSVVVTKIGTTTKSEAISGGNQTVNFKGVSGLAGLTVPQLVVDKKVVAAAGAATPGDCANAQPLITLPSAGYVTYCYTVTNYAAATSYNTTLIDDMATSGSTGDDLYIALKYLTNAPVPATNGTVAPVSPDLTLPGGGAFATGSMTVNLATDGIYVNIASARGTSTSAGGTVVTSTASARVNVGSVTDISIAKMADRTQAANGQTITYTITVKNEGTVALAGVEVTDAKANITSCSVAGTLALPKYTFTNDLAPGATATCTATHVVDTSVDDTDYTNRATVTTTTGSLSKFADAPVVITVPRLSIEKEMTSAAPTLVGDTVTYNIYVTNIGTAALSGLVITDSNAVMGTCTPVANSKTTTTATFNTFAVGASATCAVSHIVTTAEVLAGKTLNTATFTTSSPSLSGSSNTIESPLSNVTPNPAWTITKTKTSTNALAAAGDEITYDITVVNNGNVTLTDAEITDSTATLSNCTSPNPSDLLVSSSRTCTATHIVTPTEVTARQTVNTAGFSTTTSYTPSASTPTSSNTITTPITPPAPPAPVYTPSLSIIKALTSAVPKKIGDIATYSIRVSNTGDIALLNVTVSDANATITSCTPSIPVASLAIGASIDCVASHTATKADFEAGFISNVAITQNDGGVTVKTSNEVKTELTQDPSVNITQKEVDPKPHPEGDKAKLEITVVNDGNIKLTNVIIETDNSKNLVCTPALPVAVLEVGDKIVCYTDHITTAKDVFNGSFPNNAIVKAASFKRDLTAQAPVTVKTIEKAIFRSAAVKRVLLPFTGGYFAPKATVRLSDKPIPSAHGFKEGKLLATIRVARFGKTWVRKIYEGTNSERVLNKLGVGHYEETELPGELGNFAVAGHRFAYGGAFLNIDKLKAGDVAIVETADATYTYKWLQTAVVSPSAVDVVAQKPVGLKDAENNGHYLTLTSCTPVHINTSRIAAWFSLQKVEAK